MSSANTLELDTCRSTILPSSIQNIKRVADKLLKNGLCVFPGENVYQVGCNGFDGESIENIYKIKEKSLNSSIILNCLGYYDIRPLVNILPIDDYWFKELVDVFCPGPIIFILKSDVENNLVPSILIDKEGFTAFHSPKHPVIRKLIQYSSSPIASSSANKSGCISSTCIDHVKHYFEDINIDILDDNGYISKYGVEATRLKLENGVLTILNKGAITVKNIKEFVLSKKHLHNLEIVDISHEKIKTIEKNTENRLTYLNKPFYILNIIDFRGDDLSLNMDLVDTYLDNTILIDFNSLGHSYSKKFLGYVDLSREGDFKEALFNIYNVLHELNNIECSRVCIFNFSFIENEYNTILWNHIIRMTNSLNIGIPKKCLI